MKKYLVLIFIFLATSLFGQKTKDFLLEWDDDNIAPAAPTSLFVNGLQEKDSLAWTDPTALDLDSIRIYRETTYESGVYYWLTSVSKGIGYYIDTPLTVETVYRYKVKAIDNSGNASDYSTAVYDTVKPILYYADLATDEYASKATPELSLQDTYALNETFSDGDYTSGNVWTVSTGAYAVTDTVSMYSGLTYALRCATAGVIHIPCNWAYGYVAFDWRKGNTTNTIWVQFLNKAIGGAITAGNYGVVTASTEHVGFFRDGGTGFYSANSYITNFTTYRDSIVRNTNGSFSVYIKGGSFGDTYTLVSTVGGSGTNPVTDNTYNQSNYFVLDLDAGDAIANIQAQYGTGSLDLNGHEFVKYPYQNSSFEGGDTTYWASNGTHSIDTTSTYKQSGSYGTKITTGGVGDTSTNFISLAYSQFNPIVAGNKYTIEVWLNADSTGTGLTTKPIVYGKLGSKTMWGTATDSISIYANLWKKFALTFLATTAEVNTPLKIYFSEARTYYMDGFSITEAKDGMINVWVNKNVSSTSWTVTYGRSAETNTIGYDNYVSATQQSAEVTDTRGSYAFSGSAPQNIYYLATTVFNRTDSMKLYINGVMVAGRSMVNIGSLKTTTPRIVIGAYYSYGSKFTGKIAETQIVRFTDITTETTWTPSAIYYRSKTGFNFPTVYSGGSIVASYRWIPTSDAVMLGDVSGTGNNLTGTNLSTSDSFPLLGY